MITSSSMTFDKNKQNDVAHGELDEGGREEVNENTIRFSANGIVPSLRCLSKKTSIPSRFGCNSDA